MQSTTHITVIVRKMQLVLTKNFTATMHVTVLYVLIALNTTAGQHFENIHICKSCKTVYTFA